MRLFCLSILLSVTSLFGVEPLRVGVILPLTGFNDFLGERCRKAIEMSLEDLPKEKRERMKLYWEDDRAMLKDSLLAANRLCDLENVDVLVTFASGAMKVIAPVAKSKDVVQISVAISNDLADGEHNFNIWGRPINSARLIADRLAAEGKKTVSIIRVQSDPGIRHEMALTQALEERGLKVLDVQKFNAGERDFRVMLIRLEEKKPDAIFIFAWQPEIEIILRQMKQLEIKTHVTSNEGFNFVQDRKLIEGVWYATGSNPSEDFVRRYQEKFKINGDFCESQFYDIIQILAEIKERYPDKNPTRKEIADALKLIKDRPSASGLLTVDKSGEIMIPSQIVTIKDGKAVRTEK